MTASQVEEVFIVGAGRAGMALAKALMRTQHRILGTWNRTAAASARARSVTQAPAFHGRIPMAASGASLLLLTVTDDALPAMARVLVKEAVVSRGMVVAHMAGALDSAVLADARAAGAHVGSLHPVASFSEEATLQVGTHFAVEGDAVALPRLRSLVEDVGGYPMTIEPGQKPRYHAALVFAANYMVALADMSTRLLREAGLNEEQAATILGPLVEGTARNIRREGITQALTGPVTRGDINTVRVHVEALKSSPELLHVYAHLGVAAVEVARRQGLTEPQAHALLALFGPAL
ncbi:MAG: DUF2520 domain-containing protein [Deltaproteobacteria bacterium]|nr:DUF2520 domain-containing protein [Deltaproteobacteria bacterium]